MIQVKKAASADMKLGERVKKQRLLRGMTQTELARRLGVTPGAVSRFEAGETMIGVRTLLDIVEILGIGIEDLLPEYSLKTKYSYLYELMEAIPEAKRDKLVEGFKTTLEAVTD